MSRRKFLCSCAVLALVVSVAPLQAATTTVTVTVKNNSSYTVTVTVKGFNQTAASKSLGPRTSWTPSVRTDDGTVLITATGPRNTITSRVGDNASRRIANDSRAGYIKWDR